MRKPFTCDHSEDRRRLCKRLNAGLAVMLSYQCLDCGRRVGPWLKLERVPQWARLPDWDYSLEPEWEAREKKYMLEYRQERVRQEGVAAFTKEPEAERQEKFWAKYGEYLHSEEWAQRRELVLKRAKHTCEGCCSERATQVHHLTYARVGKEMLFDLVAICDDCHNRIHPK